MGHVNTFVERLEEQLLGIIKRQAPSGEFPSYSILEIELQVSRIHIAKAMNALEERGVISLHRLPGNHRGITITATGQKLRSHGTAGQLETFSRVPNPAVIAKMYGSFRYEDDPKAARPEPRLRMVPMPNRTIAGVASYGDR